MQISITIDESLKGYRHIETYEEIVTKVLEEVGRTYAIGDTEEMSVLLCNNEVIHQLNRQYRQIDRPTDVLSFALNEETEAMELPEAQEGSYLLGDIIISLDKVKEQGDAFGHGMERELAYLTVHGALHVLGYDHMTDEDKSEMRQEEEYVLTQLGYIREGQRYME